MSVSPSGRRRPGRLSWLIAAAAVCAGLPPATEAAELFGPSGSNVPVGTNPAGMAIADLDGDGAPDLAVANELAGTVSILLGDGLGGFTSSGEALPVGDGPIGIAAGDFTGDGNQDLAVTNDTTPEGSVRILVGDGSGGFVASVAPVSVGDQPLFIAVGDYDGDGNADLAVANGLDSSVSILLGNGSGGFQEDPTPVTVGSRPSWIDVADLDGDGDDDLAVANSGQGTVSILLGDGQGGFQTENLPVGTASFSVVVDDFDGDGLSDLAVTDAIEENVRVLVGDGSGQFDTGASVTVELGSLALFSNAGDLNRDGTPDLVVSLFLDDAVAVLLGDGLGDFGRAPDLDVGRNPLAVALDDFDGDGALDLAVGNQGSAFVSVLLGDGLGEFARPTSVGVGPDPSAVAVGDFNDDGLPDLAVANSTGDSVSILLAVEPGSYVRSLPDLVVADAPAAVAVGRFDGDEFEDLVVASYTGNSVSVLIGSGAGTFSPPSVNFPVGIGPRSIAVGDVDHDGLLDLVVSNESQGIISSRMSILLGQGDGSFFLDPAVHEPDVGGNGAEPWTVVLDDFDGDDHLDLAVAKFGDDAVRLLFGAGDGTFPGSSDLPVPGQHRGLVSGDFDGNGTADLAVTNVDLASVTVLWGDGAGNFPESAEIGVASAPSSLVAGDFNADGTLDLVVTSGNDGPGPAGESSVRLLAGGPAGFVPAPADIAVGEAPIFVVTGDFDADGAPDLAVANADDDNLSFLSNQLLQRADLNGSNGIDGFDLALVGALCGTVVGDPDYRRNVDANVDGFIDGYDLDLVSGRFGELNRNASPLRAELVDPLSADPGTVTLQPSAAVGDLITLEVHVNDDAFGEVAFAEFVVTYTATDAGTDPRPVVEALRSFEPGSYLAGGATAAYLVDVETPGEVRVVVSRVPPSNRIGPAAEPLVRLNFRARRVGDVVLDFDPSSRLLRFLSGSDFEEVSGVTFAGGVTVSVNADADGPPGQRIGFAPPSLDLGQVEPGEEAAGELKISNFGFSELELAGVSSNLPQFTTFFTGTSVMVPPFGFIELPLRFSSARGGIFSGELTIESDDAVLPEARIPVLGRSGLTLGLAPTRLDFGVVPVGGEKILKLKLTNREIEPMTLTTLESTTTLFVPQADFSALAPDETGTVEIRFAPDQPGELRDELLTVGFDAPDERVVVMAISGNASLGVTVP